MGDPKKQRKKYATPSHPWNKDRIDAEQVLLKQYGLRRKQEIWKMDSFLRNLLKRAKKIIGTQSSQAELEKKQLLDKAHSLGLIEKDAKTENILNINLSNIMDRRLQTLLVRQNLSRTPRQARQLIVHGHVVVNTGFEVNAIRVARPTVGKRVAGDMASQAAVVAIRVVRPARINPDDVVRRTQIVEPLWPSESRMPSGARRHNAERDGRAQQPAQISGHGRAPLPAGARA